MTSIHQKYGCSREQYIAIRGLTTRRFIEQRRNAKTRGIGWELTFWQWWSIWQQSGHWHERGRGQGYVMCRLNDVGPYSEDNVFIATAADNSSNSIWRRLGLPRGVTRKNCRFAAYRMYGNETFYLGVFETPERAHQAYLSFSAKDAEGRVVNGEIVSIDRSKITLPDRPFDWRSWSSPAEPAGERA